MPAWEAWGGPSRRSRRAGHLLTLRQEPQIPATLALGSAFRCEGCGHVAGAAGRCRSAGLPVLTGGLRHLVCWARCPGPGWPFRSSCFPLSGNDQPGRVQWGRCQWSFRQNCLASDPRRILRNKNLPGSCLLVKASQRPAWSLAPTGHPREAGTEARLSFLSEREAQSGQSVRGTLSRAPRTRLSASSLCQEQREPGGPRWAQALAGVPGPRGWLGAGRALELQAALGLGVWSCSGPCLLGRPVPHLCCRRRARDSARQVSVPKQGWQCGHLREHGRDCGGPIALHMCRPPDPGLDFTTQ